MRVFPCLLLAVVLFGSAGCKRSQEEHSHESDHGHAHPEEADHGHHHEAPSNVGPGFAVLAADPHDGFRLSETAIRVLGIRSVPVPAKGGVSVPHEAVVHDQNLTGVYRLRDGRFKFIEVAESRSDHRGEQVINSPELKAGDQVAVSGAALLRVTELDLFTEDVEGHHH